MGMDKEPDSVQTPEEDAKNSRGMKGLQRALTRAVVQSAKTPVWSPTRHVVWSRLRKDVVQPIAEIPSFISRIKAYIGQQRSAEAAETQSDLFTAYSQDEIDTWIQRARFSWCLAVLAALIAAMLMSIGAAGGETFTRFNFLTSGLCMLIYGLANGMRCARDVQVMSMRRQVPLSEFFSKLNQYWCPFPPDTMLGRVLPALLPSAWIGIAIGFLFLWGGRS